MARVRIGTAEGLLDLPGPAEPELGADVTALASGPSGWWALLDRRAVWRDAGEGWAPVADLADPSGTCILADGDGAWVGTAEAHLVRVTDAGAELVGSFEAAPGRETWYTPWGGPPAVRFLAGDEDGALYVNVHVGGILRSPDRAATWEPTIDVDADVHQVLAAPLPPGRVLAATAGGLAESHDGGAGWRFQTEGLHAAYCRAVAVAGGTVLLSASRGPRGGEAALYRRPLEGGPFERCRDGLPASFPDNLDTHLVSASGVVAAFGTSDGRVFLSRDEGRAWDEAASGLPRIRCLVVDA
ncbi:MAG TPA: hypothetical protein VNO17_08635 [Actinomycetota bacterium]|nr:hypothetical protein [Actinomycetota bacterium]